METKGSHAIIDLWEPEDELFLTDIDQMRSLVRLAISMGGMTPLEDIHHKFETDGYSLVVLLKESHVAVHTYPEHKYMSIDIYACGEGDALKTMKTILSQLNPEMCIARVIKRGEYTISDS